MDWEKIRIEYENSSITLKALAEKHDIKLGTLKSRKSREGWSRGSPKKDGTKNKKVATPKKKDATKKVVIESDELNEKQKNFCLEYIKCFNATKAYQKAYECSYQTADTNGARLLGNARIKQEINRLKAEMQSELFVDATDIAREYLKMAFADITDFLAFGTREVQEYSEDGEPLCDPDGNPETRTVSFVEFRDYREVDGTLIQEVKQGRDGVSIKLYDKQKALQELDKRLLSMDKMKVELLQQQINKVRAEIEQLNKENTDDESEEIIVVDAWSDSDE